MIVPHVPGAVRRAGDAPQLWYCRHPWQTPNCRHRIIAVDIVRLLGALAIALLLLAPSSFAAVNSPRLLAADAAADGAVSKLSLALSAPVQYHIFSLSNPDRVVIDLPSLQMPKSDLPRQIGLIGSVRVGRPKVGYSRLVIECTEPATVEAAHLIPHPSGRGHLLTVNLRPAGRGNAATSSIIPAATGRYAAAGWTAPAPTRRPAAAAFGSSESVGSPSPSPRQPARVVVIDPGHGGRDPGAMTAAGLMEKTITLSTARELRRQLGTLGRYRVVLTRDRDVFIPLRDRIAIARRAGADLMISIHANKLGNPGIRGLSVYTLSERASDAEAAALAESENKADLISHMDLRGATPDVTNILIDLAQRDTMNNSIRLASLLVDQAGHETALLSRPHRFAGFAVLKAPDVPSVLVELGFLSNHEDVSALTSAKGRQPIIRAIARGIDAYFARVELANSR